MSDTEKRAGHMTYCVVGNGGPKFSVRKIILENMCKVESYGSIFSVLW